MKITSDALRQMVPVLLLGLLSACATTTPTDRTFDSAKKEMSNASRQRQANAQAEDVGRALLPPLTVEMPKVDGRPIEPRFDLAVNNAPAGQVFMAIVSGTRYSMVVHPGVKDPISVNLRDVTVFEALETIREVYGYEYKVQGNRILVEPLGMQTRVYQVNYLMSQRKGKTEVRVTSGAISDAIAPAGAGSAQPSTSGTGVSTTALESSRVSTSSHVDFWTEIGDALRAIVGKDGGRNVVISPQAGVIVVRALPAELRGVSEFLRTMQVVVERQVMLEAKI
ncbi:MAG: secretin N-terminal domain-containing protein, partial [Betaproteobacteria bacterium]